MKWTTEDIDPFKLQYVIGSRARDIKDELDRLCRVRSKSYNFAVILTILSAYAGGISLIVQPQVLLAIAGLVPLTLSMVAS